jgi:hypothetical protein
MQFYSGPLKHFLSGVDTRAINDKVRLLAKLGGALIEARESGADWQAAVASVIGWDKLARSVEEAKRLARPDKVDLSALAARAWPVLHRLGPLFLGSLQFHAVPAAAATLRAVELLRSIYEIGGGRKWPRSFRAAKHAADSAVKQGDGIVGQARDRVEHRRDQGCAAAQGRQGPQMLSGEAGTLARKLAQALRVDAFRAGRIETDCSENGALLYQTRKGAVTGSAWRLTRPGQLAHRRAFLGRQQRIQRFGLLCDLQRRLGKPLPDNFIATVKVAIEEAMRPNLREVAGATAFIRHYSDMSRCIASSSTLSYLRACLDTLGLATDFGDKVFSADMVARGKPYPDLFLFAADQIRIPPQDCVVIEAATVSGHPFPR